MASTSPPAPTALLGPALALLGPVLATAAGFALTRGHPLALVGETGALAYLALVLALASAVGSACVMGLTWRDGSAPTTLAALLGLFPWAVTTAAQWLGADSVSEAAAQVDLGSQQTLTAVGAAELMSARALGACLVAGHALALCAAFTALAYGHTKGSRGRADGALGALAWLGIAAVTLAVMVDAGVLRVALEAARELDPRALASVLSEGLAAARDSQRALLAGGAACVILGLGGTVMALRGSTRPSRLVAFAWVAGLLLAGGDLLTLERVAATLALPAPWADQADFAPLDVHGEDGVAGVPDCVATPARVACGPGRAGAYPELARVIPRAAADQGVVGPPDRDRWTPRASLLVALDARVQAPELRQLVEAAADAGYDALVVVGGGTPPAFLVGAVPPMLRSQVPRVDATRWMLRTVEPADVARWTPRVVDVWDEDSAGSVALRAQAVDGGYALVLAAPLPRAPAESPNDPLFGALGTDALGDAADAEALAAPDALPPGQSATSPRAPSASPVPLDPATVSRVVRMHSAAVRACYQSGLAAAPDLAGRVDVRFSIRPNGRVTGVETSGSLSSPTVLRCIRAEVAQWTFPASEGREAFNVTYPFVFHASP